MLDKYNSTAFFINQKIPGYILVKNTEGRCTGRTGETLRSRMTLVQDSLNHTLILQEGTDTFIAKSRINNLFFPVIIHAISCVTLIENTDARIIHNPKGTI